MRILWPKKHSQSGSPTASGAPQDPGDGVVRSSLPELIGLSRYAQIMPLPTAIPCSSRSGQRLSGHRGRGMEFAEARPYQPGDDVRTLDWRVTARTGKTHTKLFREERERPVFLWVDDRSAMHFATRGTFKSVTAARTAALLGWSALRQGDRVGGQIFGEERHADFRPQWSRKALLRFLQQLADSGNRPGPSPGGGERLDSALERLWRQVRPGSLVFLLSDFRHLDERGRTHLARLARHSTLAMVFIHDPLETHLPPAGRYRLGNGRRELTLDTTNRQLVDAYRQHSEERRNELRTLARQHGILWLPCATTDDPLTILQRGLGARPAGRRGGRG